MIQTQELEDELVELIAGTADDPLAFTERFYSWGAGELANSAGPRIWQAEILSYIRDHLKSKNRFQPCRIAVASGQGIGKSALVSFLINWGPPSAELLTEKLSSPVGRAEFKRALWKRLSGDKVSASMTLDRIWERLE